ncbi:MAG TPA: enoyl-CoA hydratase/isomerase family protein [Candidatus Binataceae bacterium]|nr:enoyl-CoA hydratase/isomerase family protein [Candidatus Binataceae bacterium]
MEYTTILFDVRDHVATITINRPERMNGYSEPMIKDLLAAIDSARQDDDVRVLIITGTGRAFCAGGDISGAPDTRSRFHGHPMGHLLEMREGFHQLVLSLTRFDKPVIAAINGAAVAGGLTLALCCDFRIASDEARLGDTALKFGLLCDEGGAYFFPRVMGLDRALKMTMLSEVYDAKTALELGLVTEVVPHAKLMERAEELARRLAEGPPLALRTAKRMMYKQLEMTLTNALEDAALNVMITNPSEDVREGTRAFKEKRKPNFKGR